jgi:hypothetical protein
MEAQLYFRFHVIALSITDETIDFARAALLSTDARWQHEIILTSARAGCHWSDSLNFARRKDGSKIVLLKRIPRLLFVAHSGIGFAID